MSLLLRIAFFKTQAGMRGVFIFRAGKYSAKEMRFNKNTN